MSQATIGQAPVESGVVSVGDLAREFGGGRELALLFRFLVIWNKEPHRKQGRGMFVDLASARRLRGYYAEYQRLAGLDQAG